MSEMTLTHTIETYQEKATKIRINASADADIADFISICRPVQSELKEFLAEWAKSIYGDEKVTVGDGFILVEGTVPVLLTAHMDTVHKEPVKDVYEFTVEDDTIITSPQGIGGDDRCGVYMIKRVVETGYTPWILFCEDEEVGGVGSNKFIKSEFGKRIKDLKFYIELDRANSVDAVYYNCGNEEFQKFILDETGYKKEYGSFSDISHLSPTTDVASVNLSCGYYKAHTTDEYVVWQEMLDTIEAVELLLESADEETVPYFDYQQRKYDYKFSNRYSWYMDDYDDDGFYGTGIRNTKSVSTHRKSYSFNDDIAFEYTGYFYYLDEDDMECEEQVTGDSKLSCIAKFLMTTGVSWNDVLDYYFDF